MLPKLIPPPNKREDVQKMLPRGITKKYGISSKKEMQDTQP